jgi:GTP pyrophosphokinase
MIETDKQYNPAVQEKFDALSSELVASNQDIDMGLIQEVFDFAYQAHAEMKKRTGAPFILHPLEVARIVNREIGLGQNSISAALLHDVVTYTGIPILEIEKKFGPVIASVVEGLTKLSGLDARSKSVQAENFRKLLLTLATDVRVILVKIADRLQNMRTMEKFEPRRQLKTAMETSYLYAPLAHRMGLYTIKTELEDLALKYIDPEVYQMIEKKLEESKTEREKYIARFVQPIQDKLDKSRLKFEIKSRTKSISSIWNKISKKHVDFEEIYDIFAIRIILDTPFEKEKEACWRVYSMVTDIYQPNPGRLRDWLSIPKSNGYESLHTTVLGPGKQWVEVQIRTQRMHELAEKGLAAHWRYKGVKSGGDRELDKWLSHIREMLEAPETNALDFMDNVKLNLYNDEVYVFTPKGDLKKLPLDSTVLDFAYEVHSELGNSCVGGKVNGKNVPLKETLHNGDEVEIFSSKNQRPKEDWLSFIVTSKARSKIKAALKEEMFKEAEMGKELIKRRFKNWKIPYNDEVMRDLVNHYKCSSATDFYFRVAQQKIDPAEIKEFLSAPPRASEAKETPAVEEEVTEDRLSDVLKQSDDVLVIENSINNVDYKLAGCCSPVFGDKIFGFVTVSEGIKIHRWNCPNAGQLLSKYAYRVVRAKWTGAGDTSAFQASIQITAIDEPGMLGLVTDVISKDQYASLRSVSVDSNDGMFEGILKILVKDKKHLEGLSKRIMKIKGMIKVVRL